MDKENMANIHNRVLFNHKEEENSVFCSKMDGTGVYHVKQNKPDTERQVLHIFSQVWKLKKQETKKKQKRNLLGTGKCAKMWSNKGERKTDTYGQCMLCVHMKKITMNPINMYN